MLKKMKRAKKGLPKKPYEEWHKEQGHSDLVARCIEHLDLDRAGPNRGTNNKLELTKRTLQYTSAWQIGTFKSWTYRLSIRLGLSPRVVKDNYLDPLISEGIIRKEGMQLRFVGPPESGDEG